MKIIKSDEELRRYIPQAVMTAEDEISLFDKINAQLQNTEQWAIATFIGDVDFLLDNAFLKAVVAFKAMAEAVPLLDLVLTPNGFGVVNNANVVPASRDRVERLIASLRKNADVAIINLLDVLYKTPEWKLSKQHDFFTATLIYSPVCIQYAIDGNLWEAFLDYRDRAILLEDDIAVFWMSHDLMNRFRTNPLSNDRVRNKLLATEIYALKNFCKPNEDSLVSIVDYIKKHADEYSEWHNSDTAKLFAPPIFVNKKKSTGYFF